MRSWTHLRRTVDEQLEPLERELFDAQERVETIIAKIAECRCATLEGVAVKARAISWCISDDGGGGVENVELAWDVVEGLLAESWAQMCPGRRWGPPVRP